MLLIAERAALLSGRDDEFVAVVTMGFTGMRWGELVGLETRYVRPAGVRVEWQLYELDNGRAAPLPAEGRLAPDDRSRRTGWPACWRTTSARDPPSRARATGCGTSSAGTGRPTARLAQAGPKLVDVARRAGVSVGTVSAVLNDRATVP